MMNNATDELKEALGMGISRRTMLRRMGYGMAGAALAPTLFETVLAADKKAALAGASLSDFTPVPVWQYTPPASYTIISCVFLSGAVLVTAQDAKNNNSGLIYSIDSQTMEVRWSHSYAQNVYFNRPLVAGSVLYTSDNSGNLYAVDITSGGILWQRAYQVANDLLLAGGNIIFTTTDGQIYAVDTQGNPVWSYATGATTPQTSRLVTSGGVVMVVINNRLYAVSVATGELLWIYAAQFETIVGDPAVGLGNVYFISQVNNPLFPGYYLQALKVSAKANCQLPSPCFEPVWRKLVIQLNDGHQFSNPVFYNGVVYLGDDGGRFYAFDATAGALSWYSDGFGSFQVWNITPFPAETNSVFVEDGIAYLMTTGTKGSVLYAVDLTSQGQEVVSFSPPNIGDISLMAGVETGICYFIQISPTTSIEAVDLSGLVHQFFAESELMVEDYDTSTGTAQPQTTSFRSHVKLLDPNRNPRSYKSVKVWASQDQVTLTSGGQSYQIGTTTSAWLQTDAAGELDLVVNADSITSPALYLWGNFMDVGEAIVLYPDHDTLHKLSNVQGGSQTDPNIPSLTDATAYDGTSLLPSGFSGADDLAQTIRNTIGVPTASLARTQLAQAPDVKKKRKKPKKHGIPPPTFSPTSFIAYPESNTNMVYQPVTASTLRIYVPNTAVPNWTACFDPVTGSVTFSAGCSAPPTSGLPGSIFSHIEDFINNVVKGTRKVAHIAWTAAENAVQTIIDDAGNTYNFVVSALEDAASVVVGVLKTIINDIKKAVQWLSYLFEWSDILTTKDQIKTAVHNGGAKLKAWVDNQIANDLTVVTQFFNTAVALIDGGFFTSSAVTQASSNTLQSQQQNGNNPQAAFGAGGAKSYAKSSWLTSKFQANASQGSVSSSLAPGSFDPNTIVSAVESLFTSIPNTISNDFQSVPSDVSNLISNFGKLVTDPTSLTTHSFGDVLTLLKDIVRGFLLLTEAVVEDLLKAFAIVIDAVLDPSSGLLNQQIKIPVISDIYETIAGSPLTFLDLCCLLVAVPATIVGKAVGAATQAAPGGTLASGPDPQKVDITFALFVYSILDALVDVSPPQLAAVGTFLESALLACNAIVVLLGIPDDMDINQTTATYLFYFAVSLPVGVGAMDIALSKVSEESLFITIKQLWEVVKNAYNAFYGGLMFLFGIQLGVTNPDFGGIVMAENLIGPLPYCFKWLGTGEGVTPSKLALGAIDGVCDLTVAGLSIAAWA